VLVCVPRGGKRGAPHGGAPLFVLSVDKQAGLEPAGVVVAAAVRNGAKFSQHNIM
jgi:hypothetical protein